MRRWIAAAAVVLGGCTGETGPAGPQGETGPQGEQGERGLRGAAGRDATLNELALIAYNVTRSSYATDSGFIISDARLSPLTLIDVYVVLPDDSNPDDPGSLIPFAQWISAFIPDRSLPPTFAVDDGVILVIDGNQDLLGESLIIAVLP